MNRVGVVWAEPCGATYRNRRGKRPEGALTIQEASARALELLDAREFALAASADESHDNARMPFKLVAQRWLAYGEAERGSSPHSLRNRSSTVNTISSAFGETAISEVTPKQVKAW